MTQPDEAASRPTAEAPTSIPPVVTLWETYGSGMNEVAALVAEDLGVELHAQAYTPAEVTAAGQAGRIGDGEDEVWFLLGPTGSNLRGYTRSSMLRGVHEQNQRFAAKLVEDVQADAAPGGVILGRNATYILRNRPGTLHVKLDGPVRDRVARAAALEGISLEEAEEQERWNDVVRSQISLELFDWNPLDNTYYDMVFNTSNMPIETCARIIADAARQRAAEAARAGATHESMKE